MSLVDTSLMPRQREALFQSMSPNTDRPQSSPNNLPPIRKKFDKMIKKQMVGPHKQVVAKAVPSQDQ